MAGLSFSGQQQRRRSGGGILIPIVLIVLSILLMTISARVGSTGVFGAVRHGVQTVAAPLERVCSVISTPFRGIGSDSGSSMSEDEVAQLKKENEQLKVLVSQLEEYRQQDLRLESLLNIADTYALETVSGKVLSITTGWNHVATLNVGSADGVHEGMGAMSSSGLYGQVESVTKSTCTVRLMTDPNSNVAAMIQSTRATGILSGSYDGNLILNYVSVDSTVAEGDVVLTSGGGGTYPQGIIIGTVSTVEVDSSKLYYRITVTPIFSLNSCEEVLVLTGEEDETASLLDKEYLKSVLNSKTTPITTESEQKKAIKAAEKAEKAAEEESSDSSDKKSDEKSGDE